MDSTVATAQLVYVLPPSGDIVCTNVFHAGHGNLQPLILYNMNDLVEQAKAEEACNDILRLCVDVGGCFTGEHGGGIEKRTSCIIRSNG
jgi:glycolate oxidase